MIAARVRIHSAGVAAVQDLGRRGVSRLGVSANGALDQYSAQVANLLVGNVRGAPMIETTASGLELSVSHAATVAVTGADSDVTAGGHRVAMWAPFRVAAGQRIRVSPPRAGVRIYLALSGALDAPRFLGSVAPDRAVGFGTFVTDDFELDIHLNRAPELDSLLRSRLGAHDYGSPWTLDVCPGPEFEQVEHLRDQVLQTGFLVMPDSDHVGIRLSAPGLPTVTTGEELRSRGVAIGAVELTPAGEFVVLHRGRSITAGYPIVLVVTHASLSRAGQVRPGDIVRLRMVTPEAAVLAYRRREAMLRSLAGRHRDSAAVTRVWAGP